MKRLQEQNQSLLIDTKQINPLFPAVSKKFPKSIQKLFISSIADKKLSELNSEAEENEIIDYLMKWKIYSGIINEPADADYVIIMDFIKECYPDLNLYDMDQCMKMVASNKLEVKKTASDESFASFSCSYIGRILSAYKSWKKENIYDVKTEIRKQQLLLPTPEPSVEEKLTTLKQHLIYSYNEIKEVEYEFIDFRSMVFDFLYKNKFIKITEPLKNESFLFARNKLTTKNISTNQKKSPGLQTLIESYKKINSRIEEKSNAVSKTEKLNSYTDQDLIKKAADYVVVKFFLNIKNIDDFIGKITEKHLI